MVILQMVASCSPGTFCRNEYKGRRASECEIIGRNRDHDSGGCGLSSAPSSALLLFQGLFCFIFWELVKWVMTSATCSPSPKPSLRVSDFWTETYLNEKKLMKKKVCSRTFPLPTLQLSLPFSGLEDTLRERAIEVDIIKCIVYMHKIVEEQIQDVLKENTS